MGNDNVKFLDVFAGIGGFRFGMEAAEHECVGFVEWDKYARASYEAIHDTKGEWTRNDITQITNDEWRELRGTVDVICGGFPCQSFSIGGLRGGFDDIRGTMFFELARATEQIKPRFLLFENVKGILSHDKGNTFRIILNTLDELGYDLEWMVCNSKNYGLPHNRERVFIIGHFRGSSTGKVFPITKTTREDSNIRSIEDGETGKITIPVLTPGRIEKTNNGCRFRDNEDPMFSLTTNDVHGVMIREATKKGFDIAHPGDSINLSVPGSKTRRGRVGKGVANTLDTSCNQGVIDGYRIRKITPREAWRLQGFPDWAFDRAAALNSDSQLYKQAGNSVSVPVIKAIAERLGELDNEK